MAYSRLSMRKIFEVLRLSVADGRSHREIARAIIASPTTVGEILRRAKLAGLTYPLPTGLSEAEVEMLLYPPSAPSKTLRPEPDWAGVHRELRRKGVTLDLLWQEYKGEHPDGYQYSSFCDHYRAWAGRLSVSLRQTHAPGEKLFVDYAGPTVPVTDPLTGEIRQAAIFVAVLGASNYTYCDATWSQTLPDWTASHVRALEFFGGVPAMLVPDNLKSGVNKACYYDPELNPSYRDLAVHYAIAVVPARPYRPKDKAKAEAGVLLVERWVLARLRNQRFFSLNELNRHIAELMLALNRRPFKKLPGSAKVPLPRWTVRRYARCRKRVMNLPNGRWRRSVSTTTLSSTTITTPCLTASPGRKSMSAPPRRRSNCFIAGVASPAMCAAPFVAGTRRWMPT
jgi:transposase